MPIKDDVGCSLPRCGTYLSLSAHDKGEMVGDGSGSTVVHQNQCDTTGRRGWWESEPLPCKPGHDITVKQAVGVAA